jgi:hypothetical protein
LTDCKVVGWLDLNLVRIIPTITLPLRRRFVENWGYKEHALEQPQELIYAGISVPGYHQHLELH